MNTVMKPASSLTEADVDPLMWPIVQRINALGWIETYTSCEGHGPRDWSCYLGLEFHVSASAAVLWSLASALQLPAGPLPYGGCAVEGDGLVAGVSFSQAPRGYLRMSLRHGSDSAAWRDLGLAMFERLASMLERQSVPRAVALEAVCRDRHEGFWAGARWGFVLANLVGMPVLVILLLLHEVVR